MFDFASTGNGTTHFLQIYLIIYKRFSMYQSSLGFVGFGVFWVGWFWDLVWVFGLFVCLGENSKKAN